MEKQEDTSITILPHLFQIISLNAPLKLTLALWPGQPIEDSALTILTCKLPSVCKGLHSYMYV